MASVSTTSQNYCNLTMAPSSNYGWQPGMAIPTNDLSITSATIGAWQDLATTQQTYQYYMQIPPAWSNAMASAARKIRFWRINKVVEMSEGASYEDPLDELRLKIARWLKPKEACNFA